MRDAERDADLLVTAEAVFGIGLPAEGESIFTKGEPESDRRETKKVREDAPR